MSRQRLLRDRFRYTLHHQLGDLVAHDRSVVVGGARVDAGPDARVADFLLGLREVVEAARQVAGEGGRERHAVVAEHQPQRLRHRAGDDAVARHIVRMVGRVEQRGPVRIGVGAAWRIAVIGRHSEYCFLIAQPVIKASKPATCISGERARVVDHARALGRDGGARRRAEQLRRRGQREDRRRGLVAAALLGVPSRPCGAPRRCRARIPRCRAPAGRARRPRSPT